MPNTGEGLETGETRDVNSDAGFTAALAGAVGKELDDEALREAEEGDRSVASGLSTEDEPVEPVEAPPSGDTPDEPDDTSETEGDEPLHEDPAIAAYLEKYGGDTDKALQAAVEATTRLGQQGNELGESRQEAKALAERLANIEGRLEEREIAPLPVASDQEEEELADLYERYGGQATAEWIAQHRPDLLDSVYELWEGEQPARAAAFAARHAASEAQSATKEPESDTFVQGLKQERQLQQVVGQMRQAVGEEWGSISGHIVPLLEDEKTPDIIKNAVVSEDANTQMQGMEALVTLARARSLSEALAKQSTKEKAIETKKNATVLSGAQRSERAAPSDAPESEKTRAERVAEFHKALLGTETTSVRDSLTYGSAQ